MGWLTMPLSSMHPHTTPKAYLDAQFTYDRRDDAGKGRALRIVASSCLRNQVYYGVGTQNGPRYTLRFCRAFDGAHLAKRSERGGWRIGIGPEVIAGEIDMLPTER
jgi:hypothetical protein